MSVDDVPQVRFARSHGASIAYQIFGSGPPLVAIPPMAQNIELAWEWPAIRAMLERFASFSTYLHFDKRGTGASDRTLPVPEIDQRVDDLRAVMDDAGIERAHVFGSSEGGPTAIMFAATYPERVAGLVLEGTGARLSDTDAAESVDPERLELMMRFADCWGTPDSVTADLFAPSLATDVEYRAWHERYERQAASRDSIVTLLLLNGGMDVRDVLDHIQAPVLILHRVDDVVVPVRYARETASALRNAHMVELPGRDHFTYAADTERLLAEIEQFVTGQVVSRAPLRRRRVEIETFGRFRVLVDGDEVDPAAWGSRRARQLLKRLIVARGWPVTRDELTDMLWPDERDEQRLRPRLSVQLSAVRRILGGGVIADRSSVRLDLGAVDVDLVRFHQATDDVAIVESYGGELLPDDRFEDWTQAPRAEALVRFGAAAERLLASTDDPEGAVGLASGVLVADPYHDGAHRTLIRSHVASGSLAAAAAAHAVYEQRMADLDLEADPLTTFLGT
jgi:pimeloyl-ACP methyl ester carboxylesterase/DNA-binding SARP family transcriptional activator